MRENEGNILKPNLKNFIHSLRDIGYTFEVAVADIVDNSITAKATTIEIYSIVEPKMIFCILDNGYGMSEEELIEAMRLGTKNPNDKRDKQDLGKFGLGLKTASFSQCKKLTLISKKDSTIYARQWDLDYIEQKDDWFLRTPNLSQYDNNPLFAKLNKQDCGTLVLWEEIDRYQKETFSTLLGRLRSHLCLVFHHFLESKFDKINIILNNDKLIPFNPFNETHSATHQIAQEKITIFGHSIKITPYILPHHSKISKEDWERYATDEGYTKSQGFYLYRANRLLIYGTWWGLYKASDASKLVRIRIDISNDQDELWGIDVKKSMANPLPALKQDLKRVLENALKDGFKPFTTRGRKINDKNTIKFWDIIPNDKDFYFGVNKQHPLYERLSESLDDKCKFLFDSYIKGLQAYLPISAIQAQLQHNPHNIKQEMSFSATEIEELAYKLKQLGLPQEEIERLLKTEIFKNRKELINE